MSCEYYINSIVIRQAPSPPIRGKTKKKSKTKKGEELKLPFQEKGTYTSKESRDIIKTIISINKQIEISRKNPLQVEKNNNKIEQLRNEISELESEDDRILS